jgi:hypothetical protein
MLIREESAVRSCSTQMSCDTRGRPLVVRVVYNTYNEVRSLGTMNRPCGLSSRNVQTIHV